MIISNIKKIERDKMLFMAVLQQLVEYKFGAVEKSAEQRTEIIIKNCKQRFEEELKETSPKE